MEFWYTTPARSRDKDVKMRDKQEEDVPGGIIRNTDVWYLPDETLEAADPCPSQKQKENKEDGKKKRVSQSLPRSSRKL